MSYMYKKCNGSYYFIASDNPVLIHEWKFVKSCGEQTIYFQKKGKSFKFLEGQSKVGLGKSFSINLDVQCQKESTKRKLIDLKITSVT